VFDLQTRTGRLVGAEEPAKAVFALEADSGTLLAARVVEALGQEARVDNLLEPKRC
jgi:hypothetical protein